MRAALLLLPRRALRRLLPEQGAAIVEFTLVLPLLLLLMFGITDFGRAINYWIDETHLAATAARYAAVNTGNTADNPLPTCPDGSTPANLAAAIQCQADTPELLSGGTSSVTAPAKVCITFPAGTTRPGYARVTVETNFQWLPLFGAAATTLRGSADMRLEDDWTGPSQVCSS